MNVPLQPRLGKFRLFFGKNAKGQDVISCTTYKNGTTQVSEWELPSTRQMQKTSLALGKLAIFALV